MKTRYGRLLCAALFTLSPVLSAAQEFRANIPAIRSLAAAASGPAGASSAGRPELVSVAISAPFIGLNLSGVNVPALLLRIARTPEAPQVIQPALAQILAAAPEVQLQGARELASLAEQARESADVVLRNGDGAEAARVNSFAVLLDESRAKSISALALAHETAGRLASKTEETSVPATPAAAANEERLAPHGETCAPGSKCPFAWLYGGNKERSKLADATTENVISREPPRAEGWFIKQFKQMTKGMMGYISSAAASPAAKAAGMVLLHPLPFLKIYVVTDPKLVHQIMGSDSRNYSRSSVGELMLSRSFGRSILTAEGEEHRGIRKELQGAFKRQPVREHAPEVLAIVERKAAEWKPGQEIEITSEMHEVALHVFARSFFGIDPAGPESARILKAMSGLIEMMTKVFASVPLPAWVPTKFNREQKRVRAEVDAALYGLIDDRAARPSASATLLDELIASEPLTPKRKEYIRDQLTALFFAGHETSANLLSWTFHLVSQNPRVEAKLRSELAETVGARPIAPGDLDRLPYLKAVIMESMRLYPPGWLVDRAPNEDVVVGGFKIPKGKQIFLPLFLLSRSDYFDGPDDFVPERFMAAKVEGKEAFLPFGEGIHYCLGSLFAMDSVQAVLAVVLQHWSLAGTGGPAPVPITGASLGIAGGLKMVVHPAPISPR